MKIKKHLMEHEILGVKENTDKKYIKKNGDTISNVTTSTKLNRFRYNMPVSYDENNFATINVGGEYDGSVVWVTEFIPSFRVATQVFTQAKNDGNTSALGYTPIVAYADTTRDASEFAGFFSLVKGSGSTGGGVEVGTTTNPADEGLLVEGFTTKNLARFDYHGGYSPRIIEIKDESSDSPIGIEFTNWYGFGDLINSPNFKINYDGAIDINNQWSIKINSITYAFLSSNGFELYTGFKLPIQTITTDYAIQYSDYTILADATFGNITIYLPYASLTYKQVFIIKKIDSSANVVTISPGGSDLIDGSASATLSSQYSRITIQSDGTTNWWRID